MHGGRILFLRTALSAGAAVAMGACSGGGSNHSNKSGAGEPDHRKQVKVALAAVQEVTPPVTRRKPLVDGWFGTDLLYGSFVVKEDSVDVVIDWRTFQAIASTKRVCLLATNRQPFCRPTTGSRRLEIARFDLDDLAAKFGDERFDVDLLWNDTLGTQRRTPIEINPAGEAEVGALLRERAVHLAKQETKDDAACSAERALGQRYVSAGSANRIPAADTRAGLRRIPKPYVSYSFVYRKPGAGEGENGGFAQAVDFVAGHRVTLLQDEDGVAHVMHSGKCYWIASEYLSTRSPLEIAEGELFGIHVGARVDDLDEDVRARAKKCTASKWCALGPRDFKVVVTDERGAAVTKEYVGFQFTREVLIEQRAVQRIRLVMNGDRRTLSVQTQALHGYVSATHPAFAFRAVRNDAARRDGGEVEAPGCAIYRGEWEGQRIDVNLCPAGLEVERYTQKAPVGDLGCPDGSRPVRVQNPKQDLCVDESGRRNGPFRAYWRDFNVIKEESNYTGDKLHGRQVEWNDKGGKIHEGKFVDGEPDGTHQFWHDNGNLSAEISYDQSNRPPGSSGADAARNGRARAWFKNGNKKHDAGFHRGMLHGRYLEWHENGKRKTEGLYVRGRRQGTWFTWDARGEIVREETFPLLPNIRMTGHHRFGGASWPQSVESELSKAIGRCLTSTLDAKESMSGDLTLILKLGANADIEELKLATETIDNEDFCDCVEQLVMNSNLAAALENGSSGVKFSATFEVDWFARLDQPEGGE